MLHYAPSWVNDIGPPCLLCDSINLIQALELAVVFHYNCLSKDIWSLVKIEFAKELVLITTLHFGEREKRKCTTGAPYLLAKAVTHAW